MSGKTRAAPPGSPTQRKGMRFEDEALAYLRGEGLRLVERNFRCRAGEIDLICRDGDTLVFVEVRFRKDAGHGGPLASITWRKRRRLIRAALYYLHRHKLDWKVPCRFDVIGMGWEENRLAVEWIKNAFYAA